MEDVLDNRLTSFMPADLDDQAKLTAELASVVQDMVKRFSLAPLAEMCEEFQVTYLRTGETERRVYGCAMFLDEALALLRQARTEGTWPDVRLERRVIAESPWQVLTAEW